MYNEGVGGVTAGGTISAGSLAVTGVSVMSLAIVAFTLLLMGVVLVRLATVERRRQVVTDDAVAIDPFDALAAAVAATSGRED